jgi:hypothetical protein
VEDCIDEFIAMHGAVAMHEQVVQALERSTRQFHAPVAAPQLARLRLEAELAEFEYRSGHPYEGNSRAAG